MNDSSGTGVAGASFDETEARLRRRRTRRAAALGAQGAARADFTRGDFVTSELRERANGG